MSERQSGETTRQMENQPRQAVYIWCNSRLDYPRALAKKIGREDLEIVAPHWLTDQRWRGRNLTGIGLDHACRLGWDEYEALKSALTRIIQ